MNPANIQDETSLGLSNCKNTPILCKIPFIEQVSAVVTDLLVPESYFMNIDSLSQYAKTHTISLMMLRIVSDH